MAKHWKICSDNELIAAMRRQGEDGRRAFEELYSRYADRVYAYCLRVLGNEEEARDVFQEAFYRFYRTCRTNGDKSTIGLLIAVARNLCLNSKRDRKHTVPVEEWHVVALGSPYEQKELLTLISAALELLDFPLREAFVLRQYQQFSYSEMSEITGESVDVLKNRVWRAKEKLKDLLSPILEDLSQL